MKVINPIWAEKVRDSIKEYKANKTDFELVVMGPAKQWLIGELARLDIPFKTINKGAGVVKVTTKTDVCPKCGGLGRC